MALLDDARQAITYEPDGIMTVDHQEDGTAILWLDDRVVGEVSKEIADWLFHSGGLLVPLTIQLDKARRQLEAALELLPDDQAEEIRAMLPVPPPTPEEKAAYDRLMEALAPYEVDRTDDTDGEA